MNTTKKAHSKDCSYQAVNRGGNEEFDCDCGANKAQFTAGEWRIGDAGYTVFGPNLGKPSPETIASVSNKANARLIASVPLMLKALEAAFKYMKKDHRAWGHLTDIGMVENAIKTAKGE